MTGKWTYLALAAMVALTGGSTVTAASGDRTTYLTFSHSVAVPGATLAPGTYIFERVTSDSSLVRVLSRDRSHVYLTQFTRNVTRPAGLAGTAPAVMFGEAAADAIEPVKAWFPADSATGQEFLYR